MALFKVRRVKPNKRGYFVPASKREFYYISTDPDLKEGMVTHLPEFGGAEWYEILKDYGGGRQPKRRNHGFWCGRWWPK